MDRISHSEGCTFTRRGEAWSEATRLDDGTFRVRIGGPFRSAWMAELGKQLAALSVSIDHTHARLSADELWIAELHLIGFAKAPDLLSLDYIGFAEAAVATQSAAFELDSFRLLESRDYGGTLMLTLEARDSLGLLGSLLGALAEVDLFALELHIETRDGRAYDSIWLAATAGAAPSSAAREAAQRILEGARRAS